MTSFRGKDDILDPEIRDAGGVSFIWNCGLRAGKNIRTGRSERSLSLFGDFGAGRANALLSRKAALPRLGFLVRG
jgi:hypothetical protein